MVRYAFSAVLLFASILVSGAYKGNFEMPVSEKEQRDAAVQLVNGVNGKSCQWQTFASSNPMFFIAIEAGEL